MLLLVVSYLKLLLSQFLLIKPKGPVGALAFALPGSKSLYFRLLSSTISDFTAL